MYKHFKARVKGEQRKHALQVIKTGCTDRCKHGPVVAVMPQNEWHLEVSQEHVDGLFALYTAGEPEI